MTDVGAPPPVTPWGPPPGPGGPVWSPAPVAKKRRWLLVLIVAIVVLIAIVTADVTLLVTRVKPVIDATNEVLHAVKAGDFTRARDLSCADNQRVARSEYHRIWKSEMDRNGGPITDYDVTLANTSGSKATVRFTLTFEDGRTYRYHADAYKKHGRWRPCLLPRDAETTS